MASTMPEPLRGTDILNNNPQVMLGGKPESGNVGRTIYVRDPEKYQLDGKPLTEFQLLGKGAVTDTGVSSARIRALAYQGKNPFYKDVLLPDNIPPGESITWNTIGAVSFVDSQGNKVNIPRNELRLTKPRAKKDATRILGDSIEPARYEQEQLADLEDSRVEPEIVPQSSLPAQAPKKKDLLPAPAEEPSASQDIYPRFVDDKPVTPEELKTNTQLQESSAQVNQVLQGLRSLRSQTGDLKLLADVELLDEIAGFVREVGTYSDTKKANDKKYQEVMSLLHNQGVTKNGVFLLAAEIKLNEAKISANRQISEEWKRKYALSGEDARRSVPDTVTNRTGAVQFTEDATPMDIAATFDTTVEKTGKITNLDQFRAGYQDLRALQLAGDYLLDTYDSTARTTWVDQKTGKLTTEGLAKRRDYYEVLYAVLSGEKVPDNQQDLANRLRTKLTEFQLLSEEDAIKAYKGFDAGLKEADGKVLRLSDKDRLIKSVNRWKDKHQYIPYRRGDVDLLLFKGLSVALRRASAPEPYATTETFYWKALKEQTPGKPKAPAIPAVTTTPPGAPAATPAAETPLPLDKPPGATDQPPTSEPPAQKPGEQPAVVETPGERPGEKATPQKEVAPPQEKKPEEPVIPPKPVEPLTEFQATVAAVKGETARTVVSTDWRGKDKNREIKTRELVEAKINELAKLAMEETRRKWDSREPVGRPWWERWGKRAEVLAERIWRGGFTEFFHNVKERRHAAKLYAETGLEGDFSYELYEHIDQEARNRVKARRNNTAKRVLGWVGDFVHEFTASEKELHRMRLDVARELRQRYDSNPLDRSNPLYGVAIGEYQQMSEIASRIGDTTLDDTLHIAMKEKRTPEALLLAKGEAPRKFINQEILSAMIREALTTGSLNPTTEVQMRKKLNDYWLSDEFQEWRSHLPQDQRDKLDLSLSYATNIIDIAKEVLIPNVLANKEHYQKLAEIDFDIKLTLGTARFGPNNEIPSQFVGEKRIELNDRVWQKLKGRATTIGRQDAPFSRQTVAQGTRWAYLMAAANEVGRNEWVWGVGAWVGTKALTSGARWATMPFAGALLPTVAGSGAAGLVAGVKEYARLGGIGMGGTGGMRAEYDIQTAQGYVRPGDAVTAAELAKRDYHKVEMGRRADEMQVLINKDTLTKEEAFLLLGYIADSDARYTISASRNINLWKVTTPSDQVDHIPPLSKRWQSEDRRIDHARALAKVKFGQALSDATLKQEIASALGITGTIDAKTIVQNATDIQRKHLEQAVTIDPAYSVALGRFKISEAESVVRRNQDFEKWRRGRAIFHGLAVAGISSVFSIGMQEGVAPAVHTLYNGIFTPSHDWTWQGGKLTEAIFGGTGVSEGPPPPLDPKIDVVHGKAPAGNPDWGILHFSKNLDVKNGDLVISDAAGHERVLINNFQPEFDANGKLTAATLDQLKEAGIKLDATNPFSVTTLPAHEMTLGDHVFNAPLRWVDNHNGTQDLVLDLTGKDGTHLPGIVVADDVAFTPGGVPQDPDAVFNQIKSHDLLSFIENPGKALQPVLDKLPDGVVQIEGHEIHGLIPPGTHLVPAGVHSFNLVSDDPSQGVLLHGIKFNPDTGKLLTDLHDKAITDELAAHGLKVSEDTLPPIEIPGKGSGTFDWRVGDMGDEKGFHGPWGGLEDPTLAKILQGDTSLQNPNGDTNALKNIFRGLYENYYDPTQKVTGTFEWQVPGQHVEYKAMQADTVFHDLPRALFGGKQVTEPALFEAKILEIARLSEEAINQHNVQGIALEDMDQVHRILYELGHQGRGPATKEEIQFLIDYFSEPGRTILPWQTTIVQELPGLAEVSVKEDFVENVLVHDTVKFVGGTDFPFVPISWHRPLEAPERAKGPVPPTPEPTPEPFEPSVYPSSASPERMKLYEQRRSKTLRENPEANLNDFEEVESYLQHLDPTYRKELEQMALQIGAMKPSAKLVIAISAASHQEGKNIYDSLKNYTYQTAGKDEYEILLFANHPDIDKAGKPVLQDNTVDEIKRFQKDFPDMPIRVISHVIPRNQATIGRVRRYAADLSLLRHHARGKNHQPLIIVSNDADNKGVSPTYVQNFINKFEANPRVDGYLGQLDWDPEVYIKQPLIHIGTRLFQYLGAYGRRASGGMPSSGANFAFRSSTYAAIGGYLEDSQAGEDIALGQAIWAARDGNKERIQFGGIIHSRIYTSARRAVNALQHGLSPVEQWNRGFSAFDDEIRKMDMSLPAQIDYENPEHQRLFLTKLEALLNRTIDVYEGTEKIGKSNKMYKTILRKLGIEYSVIDDKIQITDASTLLTGLNAYKEDGKLLQEVKSGRLPASELIKHPRKRKEIKMVELHADKPIILPEGLIIIKQDALDSTPLASAAILQNPNVQLDADTENTAYLARQPDHYTDQLRKLNTQIGMGMDPATEVVIPIPVAGAQERTTIYSALRSYAQQTLDSKKFEAILFVNIPSRFVDTKMAEFDGTLAEIERARKDFPQLKFHVVKAVLPDAQVRIGNIRKIVNDLALLRRQEAGIHHDLLLISNDADNQGLAPEYLESYVKYFADNSDKEGAVGNLQFDPKGFVRFPALAARTEFVTRLDKQGFINGNVDLYGNNSVMKSSIYAAIGGYPTELTTGEQEWTGNKIRELRNKKSTLGYAGDGTLLATSLRRGILTYIEKRAQQLAFGDAEAEAKMRALDIDSYPMFDYNNTQALEALQKEIEEGINSIIGIYEGGDRLGKDSWFYRTNLESVGIKYSIEGDPKDPNSKIKITDMSRFISRQKRMQELLKAGELNMAKVLQEADTVGTTHSATTS